MVIPEVSSDMACITPIRIKAKRKTPDGYDVGGYQMVPCGKCPRCRLRRVNDWVIRLLNEDRKYLGGVFVTLTYSPEHVPRTPKNLKTVDKRDIQLFMKRLRFNKSKTDAKKVKYFFAAEYGSKTQRPHYHAVMFGCTKDEIDHAWHKGEVHVGNVTEDSIAYSLKYITKDRMIPMWNGDDRVREFTLSSINLGISYLTPQVIRWHQQNNASYYVKNGGYLAALPRYYRDKIFSQEHKDLLSYETQKRALEAYDINVAAAGGTQQYYRNLGESIIAQLQQQKHKHIKNNDKI